MALSIRPLQLAGLLSLGQLVAVSSQPRSSLPPSLVCDSAALTLVQSIPVGDFDVGLVEGALPTHEAFIRLADASTESLDFTAMYSDLLGTSDRLRFNDTEMDRLGACRGVDVFSAVERAAKRGVAVRILLGTLDDPQKSKEVQQLLKHRTVAVRTWNSSIWYGGGIMHLKLWHSDGAAAYLGSANADWKSLAQVKELGVLINSTSQRVQRGAPSATSDLGRVYDAFWEWAEPRVAPTSTSYYSPSFLTILRLPPWDKNVPMGECNQTLAPFDMSAHGHLAALSSVDRQQRLCTVSGASSSSAFVSASPGGALAFGRTFDLDALTYTIFSAKRTLSMSVMDFLPASGYSGGHGGAPVYWPALTNAVLTVVYTRPVKVRILVSRWNHTDESILLAMKHFAGGLAACSSAGQSCAGSLEIRQYEVPGWDSPAWPLYSRVNHAKYIVSDTRVNIGTSNWMWGYFYQTAGASWNSNATEIVNATQQVFDRDWESSYAVPLSVPQSVVP